MANRVSARILVVDDDAPVIDSLCNALRECGYEALGCDSG